MSIKIEKKYFKFETGRLGKVQKFDEVTFYESIFIDENGKLKSKLKLIEHKKDIVLTTSGQNAKILIHSIDKDHCKLCGGIINRGTNRYRWTHFKSDLSQFDPKKWYLAHLVCIQKFLGIYKDWVSKTVLWLAVSFIVAIGMAILSAIIWNIENGIR